MTAPWWVLVLVGQLTVLLVLVTGIGWLVLSARPGQGRARRAGGAAGGGGAGSRLATGAPLLGVGAAVASFTAAWILKRLTSRSV